jgi:hypothetical protein
VNASVGTGRHFAQVPWICPYIETSIPYWYNVAYKFAADGSAVFLALFHQYHGTAGSLDDRRSRAATLRRAVGPIPGTITEIDLRTHVQRARAWEAGLAFAYPYDRGAIPGIEQLRDDLHATLAAELRAQQEGIAFGST